MGQIAITDLADYNDGKLRFKWVEMDDIYDLEDLEDIIKEFMENHEEMFITDYDCFPNLGEYPNMEDIITVNDKIKSIQHDLAWELVEEFLDYGNGIDQLDSFEDSFKGIFSNEEEYAWEFVESCDGFEQIPEHLQAYFDIESYARDILMNCHVVKLSDYNVAIFESI